MVDSDTDEDFCEALCVWVAQENVTEAEAIDAALQSLSNIRDACAKVQAACGSAVARLSARRRMPFVKIVDAVGDVSSRRETGCGFEACKRHRAL